MSKLSVLLWKNIRLRSRERLSVLAEIFVPLLPILLLAWLSSNIGVKNHDAEFMQPDYVTPNLPTVINNTQSRWGEDKMAFVGSEAAFTAFSSILMTGTSLPESSLVRFETERELRDSEMYKHDHMSLTIIDHSKGIHHDYHLLVPLLYSGTDSAVPAISPMGRGTTFPLLDFARGGTFMALEALRSLALREHGAVRFSVDDAELTATDIGSTFEHSFGLQPMREISTQSSSTAVNLYSWLVGMLFSIAFLQTLSSIVIEKETRMFELLRMMGAPLHHLLSSWVIVHASITTLTALLATIFTRFALFEDVNPIAVFLVFFLGGLSIVAGAICASTFFSKARTAQLVGSIIFTASSAAIFLLPEAANASAVALLSLFPGSAITLALRYMFNRTMYLESLTLDSIGVDANGYSLALVLGMMTFSVPFYVILGLYFHNVLPSELGVPKPFYFCCLPRYWPCVGGRAAVNDDYEVQADGLNDEDEDALFRAPAVPNVNARMEQPPQHLTGREMVKIRNLRKGFGGLVAVKKLNLDVYRGELFALLGHNGAGKTTTINMLTGLYAPSRGSARVNGYNIRTNMDGVRASLGVCPQHDVLYPKMTVRDHLELFARLKGVNEGVRDATVREWIDRVGLGSGGDNKADAVVMTLSGGQKRKLSLAMALLGDPQLVILDEPTSGLDVAAQASVRALLQQERQNRAIILTTHAMEEAEICDRIGIMSEGSLQTVGSALYLKNEFGAGYTLTISKVIVRSAARVEGQSPTPSSPGSQAYGMSQPSTESGRRIDAHLRRYLTSLVLVSDAGGEISYAVPMLSASLLPPLLDALEASKTELGVSSYSVSITSLTEVFINVANEALVNDDDDTPVPRNSSHQQVIAASAINASGNGDFKGLPPPVYSPPLSSSVPILAPSEAQSDLWGDDYATRRLGGSVFSTVLQALLVKRARSSLREAAHVRWQLVNPIMTYVGLMFAVWFSLSNFTVSRSWDFSSLYPAPVTISAPVFAHETPAVASFFQSYGETIGHGVTLVRRDATAVAEQCPPMEALQDMINDDLLTANRNALFPTIMYACDAVNVPALSTDVASKLSLKYIVNSTTADASPATFVSLTNSLLEMNHKARGAAGEAPTFSVSYRTMFVHDLDNIITQVRGIVGVFGMMFVAILVVSGFGYFPVLERTSNSKHLQLISGASRFAYWLGHGIWDVAFAMIPLLLIFFANICFGITELYSGKSALGIAILYFLFVCASAPFSYSLSYIVDKPARSQTMIFLINYILSIVVLILLLILSTQNLDFDDIRFAGYFLPPVALAGGLGGILFATKDEFWDFSHGVGGPIFFLILDIALYCVVLAVLESGAMRKFRDRPPQGFEYLSQQEQSMPIDADVAREREAIRRGECSDSNQFSVVLNGLRKVYRGLFGAPNIAVSDLYFSIAKGECFGFLGANGAGKTTTMQMLTGATAPTAGSATVSGFELLRDADLINKVIGYCPQFDAFCPQLTTRENLTLYAGLKGVAGAKVGEYINELLRHLQLEDFADKNADSLSGGNKRKLSVGIALIGNPPIVILDEPSTGVDPQARRSMWKLISSTMANRSVILTTHSMEECEALAGRIGIMAGGRLRCLGSASHLKTRFGHGYQISVTTEEDAQQRVAEFMRATFVGTQWLEAHGTQLKFTIDQNVITIANVFRRIEENKLIVGIKAYGVSNTDLAQIFLAMVQPNQQHQV